MRPQNWPPDAVFEGRSHANLPLLSREEEILLGQRVFGGNAATTEILIMIEPIANRSLLKCDVRPFRHEALLSPMRDGLRHAIEHTACNGQDTQGFGNCAVSFVQMKIADAIDRRRFHFEEGASWVAKHVTEEHFSELVAVDTLNESDRLARVKEGVAAGQKLASHNWRLAHWCAKTVAEETGRSLQHLLGPAEQALVRASRLYDGRARFSTFATPLLRQELRRSHEELPSGTAYVCRMLAAYRRGKAALQQELGHEASQRQVLDRMKLKGTRRRNLVRALAAIQPQSLDARVEKDRQYPKDDKACDPLVAAIRHEEAGFVAQALGELSYDERKVVSESVFLGGTDEEVAERTGLSRDEIRQLKESAMMRLRPLLKRCQEQ